MMRGELTFRNHSPYLAENMLKWLRSLGAFGSKCAFGSQGGTEPSQRFQNETEYSAASLLKRATSIRGELIAAIKKLYDGQTIKSLKMDILVHTYTS
jgi:hypothetical protein